ncbi:MAG: pyruvate kinase, partial [archaeon]|nr:pyruvate kinase [archaeon]
MDLFKKTKVVATLGPASATKEVVQELFDVGVNIFRLNFSHGTHESHGKTIDLLKSMKLNAGILLDTKGPEIRTGEIKDKLPVKEGDKFTITTKTGIYEETGKVSVNYTEFTKDVDVGDIIVIDSGIVRAQAKEKNGDDILFEVIEGQCDITTKRHINLQGKPVSLPTVTDQDWKDIDFGIQKKVDFIALSFVRTGDDVIEVKDYCKKKGVNIQIIAKIENYESTLNLEHIIKESDGIMFARGDLSCEISFGEVPTMQKKMVTLCSYYNKPIIIATQMVLSMVDNIQPTRAEVSDVGNAVFEGADAIMTSDETTKGKHPVLVIKTMAKICNETEKNIYSICEKIDCDDCFGVMHRGRLQRCGFESVAHPRRRKPIINKKALTKLQEETKKKNKKLGINRKYSCGSLGLESSNVFKENIISILPFVTDDIEAVVSIDIEDDYFMKNIAASRINIPMFSLTNNRMLCNQMNLIWNCQPIFDANISQDLHKNMAIADALMKKYQVKKYVLI